MAATVKEALISRISALELQVEKLTKAVKQQATVLGDICDYDQEDLFDKEAEEEEGDLD